MPRFLITLSRILVGSLFIVSGLIKANDALGFAYKLNDYFAADVLDLPGLIPYAYPLAVFICVVEIVLGVNTLIGSKMKITSWSLLLMMAFFTWLTFYSAYYNKVTDCGCFGDAIKLTPWESFYKDVVLSVLILIIFIGSYKPGISFNTIKENNTILPVSLGLISLFALLQLNWAFPIWFSLIIFAIAYGIGMMKAESKVWLIAAAVALVSYGFSYHTYQHLPIKDYRPYKLQVNISNDMVLPEGAKEDVFKDIWYYEVNGEVKEFTTEDKPWSIEGAVFSDRKTILLQEGDKPPIHDFSIEGVGEDFTDRFLAMDYVLVIVAYDISKTNVEAQKGLSGFIDDAAKAGVMTIGLSASSEDKIEAFRRDINAMYSYFFTDETTLKTIVRSNPGILLLNKGTIVGKWHHNDLPDFESVKADLIHWDQ